jgi:hypothetical protein
MMKLRLRTGLIFASWAMMLIFGCHKKKPPVPSPEAPPTISTAKPEATPPPAATQEPQNPPPAPEPPPTTNDKPPEKSAPKHPKRPAAPPQKKPTAEPENPAPAEIAKNTPPPRIVIQEGGSNNTGAGKVAGGANDTAQTPDTTQQLLDRAEANLKSITRQLSADEQSNVAQIRDWIKQSKDATKNGDVVKAYNFALKARLQSDELVKNK